MGRYVAVSPSQAKIYFIESVYFNNNLFDFNKIVEHFNLKINAKVMSKCLEMCLFEQYSLSDAITVWQQRTSDE